MKKADCCKYNQMVECAGNCCPCHKCGWNPSVHEERVKKIYANQASQTG